MIFKSFKKISFYTILLLMLLQSNMLLAGKFGSARKKIKNIFTQRTELSEKKSPKIIKRSKDKKQRPFQIKKIRSTQKLKPGILTLLKNHEKSLKFQTLFFQNSRCRLANDLWVSFLRFRILKILYFSIFGVFGLAKGVKNRFL